MASRRNFVSLDNAVVDCAMSTTASSHNREKELL